MHAEPHIESTMGVHSTMGVSRGCVCPTIRAPSVGIRVPQPARVHQPARISVPAGTLLPCARPVLPSRSRVQASAAGDAAGSAKVPVEKAASKAESALPNKTPAFKWGADMKKLGISVGIGTLLWFLPHPSGVTTKAWHLLSIFVATIVGIVTQPLPLGAVAMLGLGAAQLTKVLTFSQAFSAFASEIP